MPSSLKRSATIIVALLFLPLCFVEVFAGLVRLLMWWQSQQPSQYYVAYQYLYDGIPWVVIGVGGIVGSTAVLSNRSRSPRWLCLPVLALLHFIFVPLSNGWFFHKAIHPMSERPIQIASERSRQDLGAISRELTERAKLTGFFSCNPLKLDRPSAFALNGQTLPYELWCVPAELAKQGVAPVRPATIAMTVSADGKEAWFRVTSLKEEADISATWLRLHGDVFVEHRKL